MQNFGQIEGQELGLDELKCAGAHFGRNEFKLGDGAGSSGSGNRFRNRNRGTAKNLEPILEPVPGTAKIRNRFGTGTAEPPKSGTALEPEPRNREELGTASEPVPEPA
uniref:Uncharacterized protein n=1 Tax=Globodera pallida TaxID=36090 RepID=A0A183CED8_GLOPA